MDNLEVYDPVPYESPEQSSVRPRKKWPPTKTIYFRFGSRIICATGEQNDHAHPKVLRLSIHASALDRLVRLLLHALPPAFRSWVQATFPEWLLPTNIIFKKDHWADEFDTEVATYENLRCLQGHVIPICYGQIEYDGACAFIMSDVGGACIAEPEGTVLDENELRSLLEQALSALASLGISHDGLKLDNFCLFGHDSDRLVVVDLERVDELSSKSELEWAVRCSVEFLMKAYREHIDCLRFDGLLIQRSQHGVDGGKKQLIGRES